MTTIVLAEGGQFASLSSLCFHIVTRKGFEEPCERAAIAVRIDPESGPYSVCARHVTTSRGQMLTLADLLGCTP